MSQDRVCATCWWWAPPGQEADPLRVPFIAGRQQETFGVCTSPKFRLGYGHGEAEADEAVIENDEGWGWYTGSHFGCVHWSDKHAKSPAK